MRKKSRRLMALLLIASSDGRAQLQAARVRLLPTGMVCSAVIS